MAGGHLHTPVLGQPADPAALTDPAFESRRQAIAAQVLGLTTAAAAGPDQAISLRETESPRAAVNSLPGTVLPG